jgi:hypothetical protein
MNVVTSAMITIIVNRRGEITPRSRPMLSTISSISPRVFINTPSAVASRHPIPIHRAATALPPSFPTTATAVIARHTSQSVGSSRSPMLVRSPL